MKYLNTCIILLTLTLFSAIAFADTTQSRDGDGQKIQGAAFGSIRSASIGTKSFKCFSTASRMSWEIKVTATASTDGVALGSKMFYNESETLTYPLSGSFFQWNNSPTSRSPTLSKVCLRGYSSATQKTANFIGQ